ncbi:MAG: hypothetical protein NVSMB27_18380 [Ktedonobacteraceae bacterium]
MKKWILRTLILLFLLAFTGIVSSSAAIVGPQQLQQGDRNAVDQEALNGSCGVERWSVKTGTDADAGLINLHSTTKTTIASLGSLPAPTTLPTNHRIQPTETTVFQLQATLTEYKLEPDSDYHLILSDGSGNTMISEMASPACVGPSSRLLSDIQNARSEFDARYTVTSSFQTANVPVTITGVGFFDFLHGQTGVAPNGIELHAVLDIQFGTGGTPTPIPTSTSIPTPTTTPIPTPSGTPTITNLIQNGGFETSGSWTYAGQDSPARTTTGAHSGSYSLQVGLSLGQQGDSITYQMVTIPSSAISGSLSFYYWPASNDSSSYAWQEADIINSRGQVIQQLFQKTSNDRTWIQLTFDLSRYAGQTIGIQFLDHENSNGASYYSYMYVDDVALTVH